jgi:hypothetical protein
MRHAGANVMMWLNQDDGKEHVRDTVIVLSMM